MIRGPWRLEAPAATWDGVTRQAAIAGPLRLTGPGLEITAASATATDAPWALDLADAHGRWGGRAAFSGDRVRFADNHVAIDGARATTCQHLDPDLWLTAAHLEFRPRTMPRPWQDAAPGALVGQLAARDVGLVVAGIPLAKLPFLNAPLDPERRSPEAFSFPQVSSDAYRGVVVTSRADTALGPLRGSFTPTFTTGRGWDLALNQGMPWGAAEWRGRASLTTPWATDRGGPRAGTTVVAPWGEVDLDYRSELNGHAVHKLPEVRVGWGDSPLWHLDVAAGYRAEVWSGQQGPRVAARLPLVSPPWQLGPYSTWLAADPEVRGYAASGLGTGRLAWRHMLKLGMSIVAADLEGVRFIGDTPFLHDRVYPADRVRLGAGHAWSESLSSRVDVAVSRAWHEATPTIEDVAIATTYHWHCFAAVLTFRPLIQGVEGKFIALNF